MKQLTNKNTKINNKYARKICKNMDLSPSKVLMRHDVDTSHLRGSVMKYKCG